MPPSDFRALPNTELGLSMMSDTASSILRGVFKAALLLYFGMPSEFNIAFTGAIWLSKISQFYEESASDPDGRLQATQSKRNDLVLQLWSFGTTFIILSLTWLLNFIGFN